MRGTAAAAAAARNRKNPEGCDEYPASPRQLCPLTHAMLMWPIVQRRTPRGPDFQALARGAVPEGHVMPSVRFYTIVQSLSGAAAAIAALAASAGDPGAVETLRSIAAVPVG